ncbi:MAG: hypothetical protein FJ253_11300, partial [Phycisphaerae bacterium]|nr:hypothetical protein [Phycisphaerae bacterium]
MNRPPDAIARIFRRSLAGALIAAWIAADAAAVQAPPIEPPFEGGDEEELNRANHLAAVSQMRLRLRSMLDDREREEASVDRSALLSRKLAVDAALAPAVLLLELGGQGRLEPAAMLRVDYEYRVLEMRGPEDAAAEAVSQLGTAWHSEVVGGLGFEYRSSRNGAAEDDFPAFVHWRGMIRGESLAMRAHWFEPFLAQRRVDFPLNPEALLLEFSPEGVSIRSPFPTAADARASFPRESPRLRNPSDLYDLVDSLRVASFVLRHPAAFVPDAGHAFTLVDGRASEGDEAPQELRSISWRLRSDGVDRLDIWQ